MSTRRQRDKLDLLTSRIFLFLLGSFLITLGALALSTSNSLQQTFSIMGAIFYSIAIIGLVITLISVAASEKFFTKTANATGSHEILIVFILAAVGIVWIFKRLK